LRLLENGEIQPVGSPDRNRVDVAVIGATNRDLSAMVAAGTFRRDLLARFERQLHLPPLRDRIEDIYAIACAISAAKRAPLQAEAPAAGRTSALTAEAIRRALAESGGNQALAARALGVTRGRLLRALKRSPESG